MAKSKKKNNVQITSVKSDNEVLKSGVETTVVNKKPRQNKKNNSTNITKKNVVKKNINTKKKTTSTKKKTTNKTPKKVVRPVVKEEVKEEVVEEQVIIKDTLGIETPEIITIPKTLTPEEVIRERKERNRRKYEKGQKKYREAKEKKKIILDDIVVEEKKEELPQVEFNEDEYEITKKIVPVDTKKDLKEQERKEKRKTNVKTSGFTQTLTNIKELSVTKINDVREMTTDDTIPLGKTFEEQTKRSKRLIIESIIYAVILTIINVLCILIFDYFNFLRLFDVKALNVVVTILISLIFNFFVAFMIDYFVTEIWAKKRRKKDGEQDGDSGFIGRKNKRNFKDKEGE